MTAQTIDGRAVAQKIKDRVRSEIKELSGVIPPIKVASILVGDNAAAALYIRNQERTAGQVGILFENVQLSAETSEAELVAEVKRLNADETITGIIVQRPLPEGINTRRIQAKIHPDKDIEGLNPANMGFIVVGEPKLVPCTALASIKLLLSTGVDPHGLDVVVIGHSEIVGKPIAFMLLNMFATVTVCHVATADLREHTLQADVIFIAVGKPGLLRGHMLKPGCIVIDIGINQVLQLDEEGREILDEKGRPRTRVIGDVDFESAREVAGAITPVPGGVGPVTVATLLLNAVMAARFQHRDLVAPPDPTVTAF